MTKQFEYFIFASNSRKKCVVLNERGSDLIRNWTVSRDRSGRPFCLCGFMVLMFGTTDRMTRAARSFA